MNRRMTSLEVINTDAFFDMPQSSQLLYFHLNARADDDGFVANPKSIMRNCGSQGDDFKILVAKKFIINFNDGVCVIKHWRINNYIRKDIYKETKYLKHKQTLFIRPNGAYTLTDDGRAVPVPSGHFQVENLKTLNGLVKPDNYVHGSSTSRALRLGKVRLDKSKSVAAKAADPNSPLSREEYVKKMRESPRRYIRIIGEYADEKKLNFTTVGQWKSFTDRNLRIAKRLEPFTDKQLAGAIKAMYSEMEGMKKDGRAYKWGLETLAKYLEN